MSHWYYSDSTRTRQGPVDAEAMAQLHREGRLAPDTLVWREGLTEWQPWRTLMSEVLGTDVALSPPPAPAAIDGEAGFTPAATPTTAPESGDAIDWGIPASPRPTATVTDALPASWATADSASPYAPPRATLAESSDYQAGGEVVYAGFLKRFAAVVIDGFAITIAYYAVVIILMLVFGMGLGALGSMTPSSDALPAGMVAMFAVIYGVYPIISGLYYVGFESSSMQATLGKMAVGIKVTDGNGQRLRPTHALGRWVSHLLSYLTLYVGYIMAGFTDRKRGLHDMVANTLVVDRWAYTGRPDLQRRELGVVTIVMLVLAGLAILGYGAILAFVVALGAMGSS
ncbi:RDD family protein [Montanilutibacter psychrotolerans]|uniref:RDD family protein n=1 Tax=Montanilutibacter psychrotolerans TaxID=1327343 RepID=A0A3M8T1C7_9GAMM|nr:RDD family protein [Lysobacter psychrotolerans]RNF84502.1 RDD family protein [Lysobacter psychrotolerans]